MKYQISITGMHCDGCKNLIKFSLEELGFKNVLVNLDEATFETNKSKEEVNADLKSIFESDLANYKYSNLLTI